MKKIYILILTLCLVVGFTFVASAADEPTEDVTYMISAGVYTLNETLTAVDSLAIEGGIVYRVPFVSNGQSFDAFWFRISSSQGPCLTYRLSGGTSSYYYIYSASQNGYVVDSSRGTNGEDFRIFEVTESTQVAGEFYNWFNSNTTRLDGETRPTFNLYQSLYRIIVEYVFNGEGLENGVLTDQMQHLVVTLVATMAWLFCVAIPFIVIYWLIIVITTGFRRF